MPPRPPRPVAPGIPPELGRLIAYFAKIKTVGDKTALRYALGMVNDLDLADALGHALLALRPSTGVCRRCNYLARAGELCVICADSKRDPRMICVVASFDDVIAFEQSGAVKGRYFVMGKLIDPIGGIDLSELPLAQLAREVLQTTLEVRETIKDPELVIELVVSMPPSVEGETTGMVINRFLGQTMAAEDLPSITRLAQGLPVGAEISYAGAATLQLALEGRKAFPKQQ